MAVGAEAGSGLSGLAPPSWRLSGPEAQVEEMAAAGPGGGIFGGLRQALSAAPHALSEGEEWHAEPLLSEDDDGDRVVTTPAMEPPLPLPAVTHLDLRDLVPQSSAAARSPRVSKARLAGHAVTLPLHYRYMPRGHAESLGCSPICPGCSPMCPGCSPVCPAYNLMCPARNPVYPACNPMCPARNPCVPKLCPCVPRLCPYECRCV